MSRCLSVWQATHSSTGSAVGVAGLATVVGVDTMAAVLVNWLSIGVLTEAAAGGRAQPTSRENARITRPPDR